MKRRRTTLLEVVDRIVVMILGAALVAAGVTILAIAFELIEPPDLTGMAEMVMAQLEAWPATAVIAVAAVVAILAAAYAIRHFLPAHQERVVSELRLPSGDGRHRTEVRGRALSKVVEDDLGRLSSVRESSARLVCADPPAIDAKVTAPLACDLDELRAYVTEVVERLDRALGRTDVQMRVRIGFISASESRVE